MAKVDKAVSAVSERLEMARERIADLEEYVGEYIAWMGACDDSDADAGETLCESPDCRYCEMARVLQPGLCGLPLRALRPKQREEG